MTKVVDRSGISPHHSRGKFVGMVGSGLSVGGGGHEGVPEVEIEDPQQDPEFEAVLEELFAECDDVGVPEA